MGPGGTKKQAKQWLGLWSEKVFTLDVSFAPVVKVPGSILGGND